MSENDISVTEYQTPSGERYRIRIVRDFDAESPRGNDNPTVMHTFDRSWLSPDREPEHNGRRNTVIPLIPSEYVEDGAVDMRYATRWVNLFGKAAGVLAIAPLYRVLGGWAEGGLEMRGTSATGGRVDGYIAITKDSWEMCMGDSPLQGGTEHGTPSAQEVMAQDVAAYNNWVQGNYVGFIVEKAVTWAPVDSIDDLGDYDHDDTLTTWREVEDGACWGIDDETYALTEAKMLLPTDAEPVTLPV